MSEEIHMRLATQQTLKPDTERNFKTPGPMYFLFPPTEISKVVIIIYGNTVDRNADDPV